MTPDGEAIWVAEIELGGTAALTGVCRDQRRSDIGARVLVRRERQLVGFVSLPLNGSALGTDTVLAAAEEQLAEPLARVPSAWNVSSGELLSVVVCTRERPGVLTACLEMLSGLQHGSFEVVVVDNAPASDATKVCFERTVGQDPRFRYVCEPFPGLSRARNRGLQEALGRRVAFTDDDVRVDPWWLTAIDAGFAADPAAGCVTGLTPAAELDHPAQRLFDRRYSWASHLQNRIFDLDQRRDASPLYPYSAGIFGTGANFAVDRQMFLGLGGFDEALGAGSPSGGGEDLDAFVRVLQSGRTLVYEPSAIVWHVHRADAEALRAQLFSYGVGLTAFLAKHLGDRRTRNQVLRRVPIGLRRACSIWSAQEIGGSAPARYVLCELAGMLYGPAAYARGRRRLTRAPA